MSAGPQPGSADAVISGNRTPTMTANTILLSMVRDT
ncbi:MAG: hypothetical protein QOH57_946 [Mycobacterium sp.]|jgi:hypothetical protein|nr:hypothetical protein [Mycobacterium sp.]